MPFDLSHALTLVTGIAIPSAGFLVRRLITGAREQERVTLYAGMTDIAAKMKQHGLSTDDVTSVAAFVSSKRRESALLTKADQPPSLTAREDAMPDGYWTQAAMTERAAASLRTANAQLEETLVELEHFVGSDALREVQSTWERFRDEQAAFAGGQYEGGSIAPMIRAAEAEAITQQRLAWARAELEEQKAR